MKKILQKTSCVLLAVILLCSILPLKAAASYEISGTCEVQADGGAVYTVKTLDYSYDHNTYFSLRDIARERGRNFPWRSGKTPSP